MGALLWTAFQLSAAALSDSDCLDCHGDKTLTETNASGRVISLFVDAARFAASVHKTNTCVACHTDATARHPDDNVPLKPVNCAICHPRNTESYNASVHGLAFKAGHRNAATCQDCHDSHDIIAGNSTLSPMFPVRQAQTCGRCHPGEAKDWAASVHGKAVASGNRDAPVCTDCHSEHKVESLKSSLQISEEVCARCHASERMNTKYNLPDDRVKTFFESYHGLASEYGSTVAANCASCHGCHRILPSSDPNSTINRAHLVETCGKCHPGATANFAFGHIHVAPNGEAAGSEISARANRWVRDIYLTLIFAVVGAMFVHNLLLFLKKAAARLGAGARPVLRMSLAQRWQHMFLAGSFIILAITGFALKFPDSWPAKLLGSSEPLRRWMHRIAGIILIASGIWHLFYLLVSPDGRRLARDLFPVKKDIADVWCAARYLSGLSDQKPRIGRFGYAEKMEYWAVVWGTVIMGVTGLMIWFNISVTHWAPRWVVDVALTIHYYEAVLACLAIVVWHFYHVIFDPDVYPINPACLDGRVTREWEQHEHPLAVERATKAMKRPVELENSQKKN
ncbi:MAG TPA: cytochrome b/b6 domain-containing protein [Alphaproteobacteria bacterium]|nr:cytochrome b/b6 domain-containing protein [Alphaproteobacteria bacterium]